MVAIIKDKKAGQIVKLAKGVAGRVVGFTDDQIAQKLMSMGIIPGTKIAFMRKAPFGGGCYIKADNLLIALRTNEAAGILLR